MIPPGATGARFHHARAESMLPRSMILRSFVAVAVLALAPPAIAAEKSFEEPKFSFTFAYDSTWIPAVQAEGESVTFTLSEGEVHVAVQRDPNPRQHKTRASLAEDLIRTWKGRLSFDKIEPVETKLGGIPATLVQGNGKLYDDPTPYRLSLYVIERDSKLYTVKYSGLYDPSRGFWDGYQRLIQTFRFRESSPPPKPIGTQQAAVTATPAKVAATPAPAPTPAP